MENALQDSRPQKEVEAIRLLCDVHKLCSDMVDDPTCDLVEFGRRLRMILAVRAGMQQRIESTVSSFN